MKITPPFVRSPGNYDAVQACEECCVADFGPSMTQQSQAEEADINTIVKRFGLTGQLPNNMKPPVFADFEDIFDFHSAQNAVANAQSSFNKMPAAIRYRFSNDPQEFVEFCSDPKNLTEMKTMGLTSDAYNDKATAPSASSTPAIPPGGSDPSGPPATPGGTAKA